MFSGFGTTKISAAGLLGAFVPSLLVALVAGSYVMSRHVAMRNDLLAEHRAKSTRRLKGEKMIRDYGVSGERRVSLSKTRASVRSRGESCERSLPGTPLGARPNKDGSSPSDRRLYDAMSVDVTSNLVPVDVVLHPAGGAGNTLRAVVDGAAPDSEDGP